MEGGKVLVQAVWGVEARVWVATSDDVPGLATEADTVDRLLARLEAMVPELLELNEPGDVGRFGATWDLLLRRGEDLDAG